jgi:hypothetical protein
MFQRLIAHPAQLGGRRNPPFLTKLLQGSMVR